MLGLHKDRVELSPYTSEWAEEFKKEKAILEKVIGEYVLAIEHVGSTSIPGLSAKPMLDIAVAVKDIETIRKLIPILNANGHDVLDSLDEKGEIIARRGPTDMRTHLVHVEVINSKYWNNHILFRDYLLSHPDVVKEYEDLKKILAAKYENDRKQYTASKNDFIQNILKLAKAEKGE